ncbi:hypothetical protein BCR43DRAFT_517656 [Syncephalastrum racemosum]|uniref:Uncharacterized protein n=1 Tax=Syncephalastrum racemosum TaxID=13706 RepID=A0A1X2H4V1_SYNRA|nr:hypothetical protein BCR43DRAFT_517656 [Syncephalastrum racemosum]
MTQSMYPALQHLEVIRMQGYDIQQEPPRRITAAESRGSYKSIPATPYRSSQDQVSSNKGLSEIAAVKRRHSTISLCLMLEIRFASDKTRRTALIRGVVHEGTIVKPKPLVLGHRASLVLNIRDLPIEPIAAADMHLRQGIMGKLAGVGGFTLKEVILNTMDGVYNSTVRAIL